jgi:hypothetical protein
MINTGIFWTEERSKLMYMVPYEQAAISFLAAKGNPLGLKTIDDLAGKRISVELGGIEERRTREVNDIVTKKGLKPVSVLTFNNFAEAFQALKAGQSDAATSIDATAMFMQPSAACSRRPPASPSPTSRWPTPSSGRSTHSRRTVTTTSFWTSTACSRSRSRLSRSKARDRAEAPVVLTERT